MKIGLDAMGGDFAPENAVLGAILAHQQVKPGSRIVLFGNKERIVQLCEKEGFDPSNFDIVATTQVIEMSDHPAKAFTQKSDSSITVGFKALAKKEINGFASAGSTGAMLVGAMSTVKSIPGIIRPAISSPFPLVNGSTALLLDVGINADCKPDVLYQYAILGSIYSRDVMGVPNPRVALLNIGEEEEKGNLLTKATFELMKDSTDFNFVGNVEANHLFTGKYADVVICDGFTGNVVLKQAEGFYALMLKRGINDDFINRFNYENYGGTPLLGVNAPVVIGHGASTPKAIAQMVLQTENAIAADLIQTITKAIS